MPNLPISQLPQSTALQGDELLVNVQGGVTKKQTVQDILNANLPVTSSGITVQSGNFDITGTTSTVGTTNLSGTNTISGSNTIVGETSIGSINSGEINLYGSIEYNAGYTHFRAPNLVNFESTPIFEVGLEATGSVDIAGSFTSSLTEGYFFVGNGDNKTKEFPTSSFVQTTQTGSFVQSAYISLYSSASQQLAVSGAAQPITFTSVWTQNGVSLVSGSQLVMEKAGTYQFNFVVQVQNTENAVHDSYFWVKYNGNNFPNSATQMSLLPRKNESTPSAQLVTVNIVGVAQNDNDYIELYWTGDSSTIRLNETPANGPVPETPSVIANIIRVG